MFGGEKEVPEEYCTNNGVGVLKKVNAIMKEEYYLKILQEKLSSVRRLDLGCSSGF